MPTAEFANQIRKGKISMTPKDIDPRENARTIRMQKAFAARDAKICGYGDE